MFHPGNWILRKSILKVHKPPSSGEWWLEPTTYLQIGWTSSMQLKNAVEAWQPPEKTPDDAKQISKIPGRKSQDGLGVPVAGGRASQIVL